MLCSVARWMMHSFPSNRMLLLLLVVRYYRASSPLPAKIPADMKQRLQSSAGTPRLGEGERRSSQC